MKFNLHSRIAALSVISAVLPIVVVLLLTDELERVVVGRSEAELDRMMSNYVARVTEDAYTICTLANRHFQRRLNLALDTVERVLAPSGDCAVGPETQRRRIVRTTDDAAFERELPVFKTGSRWLNIACDVANGDMVLAHLHALTGLPCALFQRISESGDMLCLAAAGDADAFSCRPGAFLSAERAEGSRDPGLARVVQGFRTRTKQWRDRRRQMLVWMPLHDDAQRVIGMLGLAATMDEVLDVADTLQKIQVGDSGYVWVVGAEGPEKGVYLVSKQGERNGENILHTRDAGDLVIQRIVEDALGQPPGDVRYTWYAWQNPGDDAPRRKLSGYAFFAPWQWVVAAGAYEDDFYVAKGRIEDATETMVRRLAWSGGALVLALIALSFYLARRLSRPLALLTSEAQRIADGDLQQTREELARLAQLRASGKWSVLLHEIREVTQLQQAFEAMISNLDALIGQVQRSGIQVTASATEIAASAREIEATAAEQAASTHEVSETTQRISTTSRALHSTMRDVNAVAGETADMAQSGMDDLQKMETVMRRLIAATESISSKLELITGKTNKITGVVTAINRISDQVNLLSLNAAIEAEKASEYGRGFSVVAREITRLAEQTAQATRDIGAMVRDMQSAVSAGVMEMDKFGEEFRRGADDVATIARQLARIIEQVRALSPRFENVQAGMNEQVQSAETISETMAQLSESADQTRETLREFKQSTEQLNQAVQGLRDEVARFKVS